MKCEKCSQSPATYHLTAIENGQKKETHLCETCASKAGMGFKFNSSIAELLGNQNVNNKPKASSKKKSELACPNCGMTFSQFRQGGRFGCPQDYEFFGEEIPKILENIHGKSQHVGRVPKNIKEKESEEEAKMREKAKITAEIQKLKAELDVAVKEEAYEKAAQVRDQIKRLEGELASK